MTTSRFYVLSIFMLATTALVSCGSKKETASSTPSTQANAAPASKQVNKNENPGLAKFAAYDVKGKLRNSNEWLGKQPVVVNFWGTWCPPCRREIPDLVRLYSEYKAKGIEIVGLAVKDDPSSVISYAGKAGMNWTMLMGDMDILTDFRATQGVPTTIFYDRNGHEVDRVVGAQTYEQFKPRFEKIL